MKVYCKKLAAAVMVVCMALGMTACGSKPLDGSQIVATVGEKEMTLGEANFLLRYQQVQTETYYESMLGEGIYEMDIYGNGTTFGESLKSDLMEQMQEYYVLEEKAAEYGIALTEEECIGETVTINQSNYDNDTVYPTNTNTWGGVGFINNEVVVTKIGTPLNIVELMHTTTINTLVNIKKELSKKIETVDEQLKDFESKMDRINDVKNMLALRTLKDIDSLTGEDLVLLTKEEFAKIYPEIKRASNPHEYYVDLSENLLALKKTMIFEARGKKF